MKEERRNQWNQFTESITAKTSSHEVCGKNPKNMQKKKANELASQFSKTSSNAN
jgi:hypothetical protein